MSTSIDCHKCIHYFVTWDERFPHGCRAMEFMSRQLPSKDVAKTMNGKECLLYKAK